MTNQEKYIVIGSRKFIDMWDANEVLGLGLESFFPDLKGEELEMAVGEKTLEYSRKDIVAKVLEIAEERNVTVGAPSTLYSSYERYKEKQQDGTEEEYWTICVTEYVCIEATGYPYENWTILESGDVEYAKHCKIVGLDDEPFATTSKKPKGNVIGKMISYQEFEDGQLETFWDFQEN